MIPPYIIVWTLTFAGFATQATLIDNDYEPIIQEISSHPTYSMCQSAGVDAAKKAFQIIGPEDTDKFLFDVRWDCSQTLEQAS
jgi:hypothetical protein